jgi:DNA-binding MarR family transcriptional regulator
MTVTTPVFDQRLIGQTEKTMNAILDRLLAGTGVTEPEWVTLVLTAAGGAPAGRDEQASGVAGALKVDWATAEYHIQTLMTKGLAEISSQDGAAVTLSRSGQELVDRVRAQVGEITHRLWGDLPAADLQIAGRVLSIVLQRAEAELACSASDPANPYDPSHAGYGRREAS